MSRCLIIINPVSGGGRARRYVMELQWQLSALFDRFHSSWHGKRYEPRFRNSSTTIRGNSRFKT